MTAIMMNNLQKQVAAVVSRESEILPHFEQTTQQSSNMSRLVDLLKAFESKVEQVLAELKKQHADSELFDKDSPDFKKQIDRLYRWLAKINDYLRNLCSGFRARILAPIADLPELKKQQPLSTALSNTLSNNNTNSKLAYGAKPSSHQPLSGQASGVVELHRIYHSLKCAVIVVPELLLVTHLFSSNQVFCTSLSELLSASEREVWQHDQPLTERNCQQQLPKIIAAVARLLHCTRIAGEWLRLHQLQRQIEEGGSNKLESISNQSTAETARLQRLLQCQNLLKPSLELIDDELSALDLDLSDATRYIQPLYRLHEHFDETTTNALGISGSIDDVNRRIKAIETEILSNSKARKQQSHKNPAFSKDEQPQSSDNASDDTAAAHTQNPLTMSLVCHREISEARKRIDFLNYIRDLAVEDVEETCMLMPFVIRQGDFLQAAVDRLETNIEEKRATKLHLQNALVFINQEAELATQVCGQVELNGFTEALTAGASIDVGSSVVSSRPPLAAVTDKPFTSTATTSTAMTAAVSEEPSTNRTFTINADSNRSDKPTVVYIKRRPGQQAPKKGINKR